jgi:DNA-directed RNA polymerase specialized sigma24 family protein
MKRRKSIFAPSMELSLDELKPQRDGYGEIAKLDVADRSESPDRAVISSEQRAAITGAIQRLPSLYRCVVLLRDVEVLFLAAPAS